MKKNQALARALGKRYNPNIFLRPKYQPNGGGVFRSECEAYHSVGSEDGIGPGLKGVVGLRDRAWLKK
ncbi:MAG: hypothetical protein RIR39_1423 [Pseudomonadota bacterium]|jgi:protein SCO1/2